MADMAVLKAIVSVYRAGEEKPTERYKTRVKVVEENKLFSSSVPKKYYRVYWAQRPSSKVRLGSFDLKFYSLTKIKGKAENYAISTQQQPSGQLHISTRWRSTRAIRMTATMMSILSQKNWLLVCQ